MSSAIYLAIPVMVLLSVGQTAVLPRIPLAGVIPLLSLLVALAWGLLRGGGEGAVWGFVAGICLDVFSVGPMGVNALTYMLTIVMVSLIGSALPSNRYLVPIVLAALATPILFILNLSAMRLFGYQMSTAYLSTLLPVTVVHGLLILPIYWSIYALQRAFQTPRVSI